MTTISMYTPRKVAVPRAAGLAAALFTLLLSALRRSSQARATSQQQDERFRDAAAVRAYAQRFARHDPRFAADLLAAADRHESV
jgi:hypothetical protein